MNGGTDNRAGWIEECLMREYVLRQILSEKPTGEVSLWQHKQLDSGLILRRCLASPEVYQRLLGVVHPNLPQIYEVVEEDGKLLILEEYIPGQLLSGLADDLIGKQQRVRRIGLSLCDAVYCLHRLGIIHRDIKPENIMVEDGTERARLLDFTAARCKKGIGAENCDTVCLGTAPYAAPEQFGVTQTDERTDIYALGILLNILMTGRHPSQVICGGRMGRIIRRCIRINADERYSSASQLKNALWRL